MPTVKVKRSDGFHCFNCNAPVEGAAERCPRCGRQFAKPGEVPPPPLGQRTRIVFRARRRGYRYAFIVLAAIVVLLAVLMRPRARVGPTLPAPAGEGPTPRVTEVLDQSTGGLERLSVVAVVDSGHDRAGLRSALDRLLHATLDDYNREQRRRVRVVWAYLLSDADASRGDWVAMAIWVDSSVPPNRRPSGIGGDAVRDGAVEYDFTNPLDPQRKPEVPGG